MLTSRSVVAELDERLGVLGDVREHEESAGQRDATNHHRLPVAVKYHEQRAHYGWKTTDTCMVVKYAYLILDITILKQKMTYWFV